MKKFAFLLLPMVFALAGCGAMFGTDEVAPGPYSPGETSMPAPEPHGPPHPYAVTAQDQVKYNELNKSIEKREHALGKNASSASTEQSPPSSEQTQNSEEENK